MLLKKFSFKKVKSTNNVAIRKIKSGFLNGIIVSDEQSKGRGRHGKKWISIKGNLFTTIFIPIKKNYDQVKITDINCNLIKECINKIIKKKIIVKKPNDLLIEKKKICGILQEMYIYKKKHFMIIGIGINIIKSPYLDEYKTTFINKYLKKKISRDKVFDSLKKIYENKIIKFEKCI